jgi:tRNA(fMet)-specific endonuclease VapC
VSKGEIYSLAVQRDWGGGKLTLLGELLRKLPVVDINNEQIIQRYAEIDAYSLSKDRKRPLPAGQTARVMGKNDLWIAATASVLKATLLTTDHDFDHLDGVFLTVAYIDQKLTVADVK